MSEEVPEKIDKLLYAYKSRQEMDFSELFEWLADKDILTLVTGAPWRLSKRDYNRLMQAMKRKGIAKRPPEKELDALQVRDYKAFIGELWGDAKEIGTKVAMRWYRLGGEYGYYDESKGKVDMPRFVDDAISFYVTRGPKIREIEAENVALWASIELLSKMYQEVLEKLNILRGTVYLTEELNQEFKELPIILAPIKSRLE